MTQTPTDALRLVPDDQLATLIQQADDGFGYSMEMVRLVDGVRTYRLKIAGQDPIEITDGDDNDYDAQQDCYRLINTAKNKVRADAIRTALAAAPASPLPGGGWKPSRNDVARRCDPKAWEFYDRHIDNPIMGAECRAEVAASIRMADAILALPAALTGDARNGKGEG